MPVLDDLVADHLLTSWADGVTSLRAPLDEPAPALDRTA